MSEYSDHSLDRPFNPEGEEDLAAELWRLWINDLKPHFEAEKDFLVKYGKDNGYGPDYVSRILSDQERMEKLVWERGMASVGQFAKVLGAHIRFKNDFFVNRMCRILDLEGPASHGQAAN